jgi:mannosyltransferase OCH1-like enzyme
LNASKDGDLQVMAMGAYQPERFGPIYTRSSSQMKRRVLAVTFISVLILTLFYLNPRPQTFESYNPASFTKSSTSKTSADFPNEFPKNIWQTGSDSQKEKWEDQTGTWISKNADWKYELLTGELLTPSSLIVAKFFQMTQTHFSSRTASAIVRLLLHSGTT